MQPRANGGRIAVRDLDPERVNWGTFRLEWLLANGGMEFFADQVRRRQGLRSVGANNNARNNPLFSRHDIGQRERCAEQEL